MSGTQLSQSEGQTFLIGKQLYLRGIRPTDSDTASMWWPAPFPLPHHVATDHIAGSLRDDRKDSTQTFLACRRSDDAPIGSVRFWNNGETWAAVRPHIYPLISDALAAKYQLEIASLMLPWVLEDFGLMSVSIEIDGSLPDLMSGLEGIGMRQSCRLREAILRAGVRRDRVEMQAFNEVALERFGPPHRMEEGAVERETRSPAPLTRPPLTADTAPGTLLLSERLYLRAIESSDIEQIVHARMRETETFHDNRWPTSSLLLADTFTNMAKDAVPTTIMFAVIRRSDDQLIGTNGLLEVDWVNSTAETATEFYRAADRGLGYGTEAKHLLLEYAFAVLGLHMVRSLVWEPNTRSAAALRKQGYRDAGCIAWQSLYRGEPKGDMVFDLLAREWFAARR